MKTDRIPQESNCIVVNVLFLGYDMINYLKNDSSLTTDDVFVKESQVNHHSPVNHRSPTVNDDCRFPECRTRYSFHAEFDGCLTVQKGQVLFLQRHNNDGWSLGNGFETITNFLARSNFLVDRTILKDSLKTKLYSRCLAHQPRGIFRIEPTYVARI